ncbi:MAG: aspartyl protease family protein [Dehalococcoidia bacterium]|nr:aspartyl protease family protein [Dehalococcoidia bacterium]
MTQVIGSAALEPVAGRPRVGKVHTDVVIRNHKDEMRAEDGYIPEDEVREIRLEGVLVDSGADTLCLPEDLIAQLGLPAQERIVVVTAAGDSETLLYQDATIRLLGRVTRSECVALPAGAAPLLGVIPLEAMGIELDLKNQVLRLLPRTGRGSHFRA